MLTLFILIIRDLRWEERLRTTGLIALVVALLVASMMFSGSKSLSMLPDQGSLSPQSIVAERINHDPIIIDGNADMLLQKASNEWEGTGESGSPIVISNYRIEFYTQGITIRNVDLFFIIDNCELADIDTQYYASTGIKLVNCQNAVISNSLAHMKETGIFLKFSEHITVTGTTVHDCSAGISVEDCYDINIHNNNFGWNDFVGVNITGSSRCTIYENSILAIPYFGIMCIVDTNTMISSNVITSIDLEDTEFDHVGVFSYYSTNFAMHNTTISDCSINLKMEFTDGSWIWDCCFLNAKDYGVYLHETTYNVTIVESCFIPSGGITAYDAGEANTWDESYSEIGNWWADWSESGYYYISGPAGSIDHYPNRFACDCGDFNYTITWSGPINYTTTSNESWFGEGVEPLVLMISAGSTIIIIIVVVLIIKSDRSP